VGVLAYGRVGVRWTLLPDGTYGTKWDLCAGFHESHRRHSCESGEQLPGSKRFRHPVSRRYAHTPLRPHVSPPSSCVALIATP
jgi:hypothetical protein